MAIGKKNAAGGGGANQIMSMPVSYTGDFTDEIFVMGNEPYRLLTLKGSGTLTLSNTVTGSIWLCGGGTGARGYVSNSNSDRGYGGGGGFFRQLDDMRFSQASVVIGAGGVGGKVTNDGVTVNPTAGSISSIAINGIQYSTDTGTVSASGPICGGSGGGGYRVSSGGWPATYTDYFGNGAGTTTKPFASDAFAPHCAGGGAGTYAAYPESGTISYAYGGNGGSNGGNGSVITSAWGVTSYGKGGEKGGGSAVEETSSISPSEGMAASFYGGGGGGGGATSSKDDNGDRQYYSANGGAGYQGVCYVAIPLF